MILRKYKYCYGIIIELQYLISLAETFMDNGIMCFIVVINLFGIVYGNTDTYRTILNNVLSGKTEHWKGQQHEPMNILNIESAH